MELNANFNERVSVHAARLPWRASPMPGVERRMLDRLGNEVARATTIVPKSSFFSHVHTGGEEFFVLEGIFQDERWPRACACCGGDGPLRWVLHLWLG